MHFRFKLLALGAFSIETDVSVIKVLFIRLNFHAVYDFISPTNENRE